MQNDQKHIISNFYSFFEFLYIHSSSEIIVHQNFETVFTPNSSWPNFTFNLDLNKSFVTNQLKELIKKIKTAETPNAIILDEDQINRFEDDLNDFDFLPLAEWACLKKQLNDDSFSQPDNLQIKKISTEQELKTWVKIASKGFGELDSDLFLRCFKQNEIAFYGGFIDKKMIATSLLYYQNETAGIYHVVTLPEHQKNGYGSAMFGHCQAEAFKNGANTVIAQSTNEGLNAWKKTGMRPYGNFYLLCWSKFKQ